MGRREEEEGYGPIAKFFTNPFVKVLLVPLVIAIVSVIGTAIVSKYFDYKAVVQNMSERFDIINENMSYEMALDTLTKHVQTLERDNGNLTSTVETQKKTITSQEDEIKQLQQKVDNFDQVTRAEAYADEGNYKLAIATLNSIENKSEDVNVLVKQYIGIYENSIVNEAESLANEGKYDDAISLIDDALGVVPNSSVLSEEKKSVEPKYLIQTVDCHSAHNILYLDDKESVTMTGKKFRHGFKSQDLEFSNSFFNNAYSASISYSLEGKYKQLYGIVGHIDFSGKGTPGENDGQQVYTARFTIWGDDKELRSYEISPKDKYIEFNDVSLNGVDILEFQIECDGNSEVGVVELSIR